MRQILITRSGKPRSLKIIESISKDPRHNEIKVAVKAIGINFSDLLIRIGLYPDAPKIPAVIGYEVSGIILETGSEVKQFKIGDRITALTKFGGYSNQVTIPAIQAIKIGNNLSFEIAAAIPVQYLTAWIMLITLANIKADDTVLIHSAGGGVGLAAIDIAKWQGATIIGTASAGKHLKLKQKGVSYCIDYRKDNFSEIVLEITKGRGADIIIDPVGGNSFRSSYKCLAPLGRLYIFGASSFASNMNSNLLKTLSILALTPIFLPLRLITDNRGVHGINLGKLWGESEKIQSLLSQILYQIEKGQLFPQVDRTYKFDEVAEAHKYMMTRKNFGKVILTT